MTGRRLAHYEIIDKIGSGGMGEVFRARDTKLGREVALKILPESLAADPERAARFETEARAVAALRHPSIVTIHGIDEADGVRFMAMELVEGKTLTQSISPGGLPLDRFLEIAIPLADAVAAAHAKGITHRDLKPDNVMVEPDGRIKVLDFGLAKLLEVGLVGDGTLTVGPAVTASGRIMGTVAYMSPEQAEGKPVDPRSDVFSLGIVLYEMITGDRPFQGDTHISTITAILRDTPKPVHERRHAAPRQLDRIVQRCLEKSPDRRYETARGLRNDLESLKVEETSQASVAAVAPPPAASRRVPAWAWIGGVVLVAGLLGGWYAIGGRGDTPAAAAPAKPSMIVVFPFENMGSADDQYFAAGISEEITSRLSALSGLGVVSRTSANQYDRKGKTMATIAADLGVDYVLDGTVRWARNPSGTSEVRITPQLIKAKEDRQVWSASYDRSMDQIFRIQSEIAGEVVDKLGMAVGGKEKEALAAAPTDNVEAYHAYLRAHELHESIRFSREDQEAGIALLDEACAKDPRFLRAWAELAKAHAAFIHFAWDPTEARLAKAKEAADRALAIDPESPWAQLGLGYYHYWGRKDYASADAALSKAQAGLPSSAEVAQAIGVVRRRQGRFEEASAQMERAGSLDPKNPLNYFTLGETQAVLRRYDAADASFERSGTLAKEPLAADVNRGRVALLAGDAERARQWLDRSAHQESSSSEIRIMRYWLAMDLRAYDVALRLAEDLPEASNAQFEFECRAAARGFALEGKGDAQAARTELEKALTVLDLYARDHADESNRHSLRGRILAKLGRADEAVAEGARALTLRPASNDAWIRQFRQMDLAQIEIAAGKQEAALKHLDELLAQPSDRASPGYLRLSPQFDALRGNPEFEKLTAR